MPRCGWPRPAVFPSSCPAPSTPRSGWPPGWPWPPRCPNFLTPAAWARCHCWPGTSPADPLATRGRGAAGPAPACRPRSAGPLGDRPGPVAGAGRGRRAVPGEASHLQAVSARVNPSTAFGASFCDELVRCGLREVVLAPGSRSTPLAMAFADASRHGPAPAARPDRRALRVVHRARPGQGQPPAGGGAVHLGHGGGQLPPGGDRGRQSAFRCRCSPPTGPPSSRGPAPPDDRPDQAVRRQRCAGSERPACPRRGPGQAAYWRSLACQAWAHAGRARGRPAGPVHLNLPLRDPLRPGGEARLAGGPGRAPGGQPWTRFPAPGASARRTGAALDRARRGGLR